MRVGVWVPLRSEGRPGMARGWALGRAVLRARELGVEAVIGGPVGDGCFSGFTLRSERWVPVEALPVDACYDRFSSVRDPNVWAEGLAAMVGRPVGNPPSLNELCRDKAETQRVLVGAGVPMPPLLELEECASAQHDLLLGPGAGSVFVKPRFGSFGEGVEALSFDAARARMVAGDRPRDAWIVQVAVPPPAGWAGVSLRVLVQRKPAVGWIARSPVVRRSREDPVVNAARGAELVPAEPELAEEAGALAVRAARALHAMTGGAAVELGVDLVVGHDGALWVIEVNGRPRGRLLALAEAWPDRFMQEHVDACAQPLLTLAADAASAAR